MNNNKIIIFPISLLLAVLLHNFHVENMAKLGYQQCKTENDVLWQKKCYNFLQNEFLENMAKLGYQQCKTENDVLWKPDCNQ